MLVLLKPWRNMETDLKQSNDTWEAAFKKFLNDAPTNVQDILSNIQYFHKCEAVACNSADVQMMLVNEEPTEVEEDVPYVPENIDQGNTDALLIKPMLTQEDIHAQLAVEKAKQAGVFTGEEREWDVTDGAKARMGTANDLQLLQEWKDQMEKDVNTLNQAMTIIKVPEGTGDRNRTNDHDAGARVIPLSERDRDT